jgi:hypothetical protein
LRKFLELIESNGEIGTWGLLDQLVAHHVELLLQITAPAWWAMSILIGPVGHLCISAHWRSAFFAIVDIVFSTCQDDQEGLINRGKITV